MGGNSKGVRFRFWKLSTQIRRRTLLSQAHPSHKGFPQILYRLYTRPAEVYNLWGVRGCNPLRSFSEVVELDSQDLYYLSQALPELPFQQQASPQAGTSVFAAITTGMRWFQIWAGMSTCPTCIRNRSAPLATFNGFLAPQIRPDKIYHRGLIKLAKVAGGNSKKAQDGFKRWPQDGF